MNELPESVLTADGPITSFKDIKKKMTLKWKISLLNNATRKTEESLAKLQKDPKSPSSNYKVNQVNRSKCDEVKAGKHSAVPERDNSSGQDCSKSAPLTKKPKSCGPEKVHSKNKPSSGESKQKTNTSSATASSGGTESVPVSLVNVLAMEWEKGDIYLGVLHKSNDKQFIMNCENPVAKIIVHGEQKYLQKISKPVSAGDLKFHLNLTDDQPNPNLKFVVWKIPKGWVYADKKCQGPGILYVPEHLVHDFWKEFKSQSEAYLDDSASDYYKCRLIMC